jgi:hypothetical protein
MSRRRRFSNSVCDVTLTVGTAAGRRSSLGKRRNGEPVDFTRGGALLDAAVGLVEVDPGVEGVSCRLEETGLDLGAQARLIGFDDEEIVGVGRPDGTADGGVGGDRIDADDAALGPPPSASGSSGRGITVVSLGSSATASWPSPRREVMAEADAKCSGGAPVRLSWLRREVLPSVATNSGRSGQVSRTQAVKAAENRVGSMRLIGMVSQRPPGTPWI